MNGAGLFGGIGNALSGNSVSISPYGGQPTQGQWGYGELMRHYKLCRAMGIDGIDTDKPKKKKPGRPIEQVQAEVDDWLKDQGI